ncbi:site-specific DNA-methyltransferase [Enterococcus thailandicus]|uniref:site-specific DNA-methyltransferase n=1 Tax=Enterococcus thailandicus TaxID=417368 RepID=UPI00288D8981|nr:site-specific DNA-methyltransferase [Enterococcus thailandicus]MDT2845416.1 site-specific DNA-methyltransferase [Enterococcus thailandicus]
MDTRLLQQVKDILKEFPQYWNSEELQRPIVIDDLKNYDALLISALLKNQKIRENYSVKAGDVVIFKVQEFIDMLRYKDYWADSYTKYSNTIGLSSEGKYLQYNTDVVLDFPYKDCVLEGGMTKEDNGKEEVFYNEVIARDEIDTLLAPKALVNVKKYDSDSEHKVDSFSNEDNLIIKGNNLLALHSLKERYAGKVKLIYIDPPYNTGSDSFRYNDRFNHSTWLTFMKNRLEVAKELLADDGSIWINIDNEESAYLKILCDSIFFRGNYVTSISWRSSDNSNNDSKQFSTDFNTLFVYSKKDNWFPNKVERTMQQQKHYKNPNNDPKGPWFDGNPISSPNDRDNLKYKILTPIGTYIEPPKFGWRWSEETLKEKMTSGEIVFNKDYTNIKRITYLSEQEGLPPSNLWTILEETGHNRQAKYEQKKLFPNLSKLEWFSTPKPEKLLQRIIHISSHENDLVLDFFMGSATTQAVAMKMNRKFIGIEQMDYINTVSVPRLQKVIEGEQGGVSKDVDWQGGGSFVYAELMELNQVYINKIDQASSKDDLADLWSELDNNADLNYQLDKEKLTNELLKEHDEEEGSITFNDLTFEEQKEIFKKALDKNQLYVPYAEIEDANVIISEKDKAFNHSFYNGEED